MLKIYIGPNGYGKTFAINQEIEEFIHSKANYIGLNGKCSLITTNESIQSMYNLTKTLPGQQLNEMKF